MELLKNFTFKLGKEASTYLKCVGRNELELDFVEQVGARNYVQLASNKSGLVSKNSLKLLE